MNPFPPCFPAGQKTGNFESGDPIPDSRVTSAGASINRTGSHGGLGIYSAAAASIMQCSHRQHVAPIPSQGLTSGVKAWLRIAGRSTRGWTHWQVPVVHTVPITTGTHTPSRAAVASGVEEHSESSTRLSVRLSLSLNGTSRDAPAKDRRERISTVDP